jgi:hypothetical protein
MLNYPLVDIHSLCASEVLAKPAILEILYPDAAPHDDSPLLKLL